jgi:hypothetical protein
LLRFWTPTCPDCLSNLQSFPAGSEIPSAAPKAGGAKKSSYSMVGGLTRVHGVILIIVNIIIYIYIHMSTYFNIRQYISIYVDII